MDYHVIQIALGILHSFSRDAWTGSLLFFLIVIVPVTKGLQGDSKLLPESKMYRYSAIYLRSFALLTIGSEAAINILPLSSFSTTLGRFLPAEQFAILSLTVVAYLVVGEGFLLRYMRMYYSIVKALDPKEKNHDIAHLIVLEKNIRAYMAFQFAFLVVIIIFSHYFPLSYVTI